MGLAWKTPVPDRGAERNRLSVKDKFPTRRVKWRDNLIPASAAAKVGCGRKANRDIESILGQVLRNEFNELMFQAGPSGH